MLCTYYDKRELDNFLDHFYETEYDEVADLLREVRDEGFDIYIIKRYFETGFIIKKEVVRYEIVHRINDSIECQVMNLYHKDYLSHFHTVEVVCAYLYGLLNGKNK